MKRVHALILKEIKAVVRPKGEPLPPQDRWEQKAVRKGWSLKDLEAGRHGGDPRGGTDRKGHG